MCSSGKIVLAEGAFCKTYSLEIYSSLQFIFILKIIIMIFFISLSFPLIGKMADKIGALNSQWRRPDDQCK